jgi:energy-coupling factor transporter ATP-binding protein EcfA2
MIHSFRARNYGCLLDVTASLTPLHAFIGPNDSGKSTLLHAMRTIVQLAGSRFSRAADGSLQPFDSPLFDVLPRDGASVAGNGAARRRSSSAARLTAVTTASVSVNMG